MFGYSPNLAGNYLGVINSVDAKQGTSHASLDETWDIALMIKVFHRTGCTLVGVRPAYEWGKRGYLTQMLKTLGIGRVPGKKFVPQRLVGLPVIATVETEVYDNGERLNFVIDLCRAWGGDGGSDAVRSRVATLGNRRKESGQE